MFDINKLPNANSIAPASPAPAPIPAVTTVETVGPAVAPTGVITPSVPAPAPIIEEVKAPIIEDVPPMSDEDLLNAGVEIKETEIKENNINSDVFVETLLNSKGENGFTKLPETIKEAQELAKFLSKSTLVSAEIRSTEIADHSADVFMVIALGASLGMTPAQSLTNITVTRGRPTMYVSAKAGLCAKYGTFDTKLENVNGIWVATATGRRKGRTMSVQYTSEDAMLQGLMKFDANSNSWVGVKGAWSGSYPVMLQKRALGRLLDALFADVVGGFADKESAEENAETETEKNVTKRTIKREKKNKTDDIIEEKGENTTTANTENSEIPF
jgi:hypothetical protein